LGCVGMQKRLLPKTFTKKFLQSHSKAIDNSYERRKS